MTASAVPSGLIPPRRRLPALRRMALLWLAIALAIALAWPGGSLAAHTHVAPPAHRRHAPSPPELALTPTLTAGPGVTIAMKPAGLSIEYPVMVSALGGGECPPPALTAELQRLGSPPLELAGQSQDFTVPAGGAGNLPPTWEGLTAYPLAPGFWSRLRCLLSGAGDPLTVGLNARTGQLSWAQEIVAGAQSAATNGVSFSLGNEPDLYYLPNYASLAQPRAGEEAAAVNLYLRAAGYLRPAIGAAQLVGPELSGPAHWQASLPRVIATLGEQTVGVHLYPLSVCRTPRAATIDGLLSEGVGAAPRRLAWVVADAAAAGLPAVITEANSVSCGGKAGVSDSSAAAVWAVRFVLSALQTGFREVRFHFSGDPYDPFYMRGGEVVRRPLEAAMVALNGWLPLGATMRRVPLRGLLATAVSQPTATPAPSGGPSSSPPPAARSLLILDNESPTPRPVVLRGYTAGARAQAFSARGAAPMLSAMKGPGQRERVVIPGEAILAVSY